MILLPLHMSIQFIFVCMWLQGQGRRVRSIKESFVLCNKEREHVSQSLNVSLSHSHSTCDWLKLQSRLQHKTLTRPTLTSKFNCTPFGLFFSFFTFLSPLHSHCNFLFFPLFLCCDICHLTFTNSSSWWQRFMFQVKVHTTLLHLFFHSLCPSMHPGHLWLVYVCMYHLNGHFLV